MIAEFGMMFINFITLVAVASFLLNGIGMVEYFVNAEKYAGGEELIFAVIFAPWIFSTLWLIAVLVT